MISEYSVTALVANGWTAEEAVGYMAGRRRSEDALAAIPLRPVSDFEPPESKAYAAVLADPGATDSQKAHAAVMAGGPSQAERDALALARQVLADEAVRQSAPVDRRLREGIKVLDDDGSVDADQAEMQRLVGAGLSFGPGDYADSHGGAGISSWSFGPREADRAEAAFRRDRLQRLRAAAAREAELFGGEGQPSRIPA